MLNKMKTVLTILFLSVFSLCIAQKDSTKRIGNKGINKPLSVEYFGNPEHNGRNEVGTLVSIRKGPLHIVGARFLINSISMPDTALFFVNIYEVKDGLPTKNGLYRPVKITGEVRKGQLNVDLTGFNIIESEDFLLALSWPAQYGNISFGGSLHGKRSFHRSDNGEWERLPMMKLGFSALALGSKPE
jgi:hypothetical protein